MLKLIKKLIFGNQDKFPDITAYKNFFAMNLISISSAAAFALFGIYHMIILGSMQLFIAHIGGAAVCVVCVYLNRRGVRYVTSILLTVQLNAFCVYWSVMYGWSSGIAWFTIASLLPHYLFSDVTRRQRIALTVLSFLTLNVCLYICFNHEAVIQYENPYMLAVIIANCIFLMLVFEFMLGSRANSFAEKFYLGNIESEREKSMRDDLTGLWNRRYLQEGGMPSDIRGAVVMLDLDHFKTVNDTWGHEVGDLALIRLADAMRGKFRKTDVAMRWGGEEFLIILFDISVTRAIATTLDLKKFVSSVPVVTPDGTSFSFTFSAGICPLDHISGIDEAIAGADKCLYKAKQSGRDRIVCENGRTIVVK